MATAPLPLSARTSAFAAARAGLEGLRTVIHQAGSEELAHLVSALDELSAYAAAARTDVAAEAVRRGETNGPVGCWLREHAPSLRQGGSAASARLITEATRRSSLAEPDSPRTTENSPIDLVWAAVVAAHAASDRPPLGPALGLAVLSEVRALEPRLCPDALPTVTRVLIDLALEWGAAQMRRLRPHLLAHYGHVGELDDEQEKLARAAFLSSPRVEAGGPTAYRMALTPEQAAIVEAALGPLSAPAPNETTGERDLRSAGQRRAEALAEVCALATAVAADTTTTPSPYAAVHITMDLEQLRALTGTRPDRPGSEFSTMASPNARPGAIHRAAGEVLASRAEGILLSPDIVRRLACCADLIPHVLGSDGAHLDVGRQRRLFTRSQRHQLLLRDRHCTYPGCDRAASWTQAHHLRHWWDGGPSNIDNAALLCQAHHTVVHRSRLWGWVHHRPRPDGSHVEWDLSPGSYDRAVLRRQHDPGSLRDSRPA